MCTTGGGFNVANSAGAITPPIDNTDEWQRVLDNQLEATFSGAVQRLEDTNSALFGGHDISVLEELLKPLRDAGLYPGSTGQNVITEIFDNGDFLADLDVNNISRALLQGLDRMRQSLVAGILRAQNFYVFINTEQSKENCDTITGSRWVDDMCMIISKRVKPTDLNGRKDTEPVNSDILLKLDGSYGVDVEGMYRNAYACGGKMMDSTLSYGSELPQCFWSLPIVKVDGEHVCDLVEGRKGRASAQAQPMGLQLTERHCGKVGLW